MTSHPLIFAHRGASHDAPENTLESFALGWEQGADGLELDIHLTRDGRIVVMHDADTQRTTGQAGRIAERTFAELRALDAGSWKGATFAGARVPALEEVLAALPAGRQAIIEIKCGPEIIEPLRVLLEKAGVPVSQLLVHCFNFETICAAKRALPGVRACWLVVNTQKAAAWKMSPPPGDGPDSVRFGELVAKARAAGLDAVNPDWEYPLDRQLVEQAHAAGLGVYIWTVNTAEAARRLAACGVDGLMTDRPGWLREQLNTPAS